MDPNEDLVKIEAGRVEAVGAAAALRLQARQGLFDLVAAPPQMVVLRARPAAGDPSSDTRSCRLSGEITAAGDLCDVFGLVSQTGWSGELVVYDAVGSRSLFVDRGELVGASSTVHAERLGQVLYRYGVLTEEQVATTLASAANMMWFGEAAVKLGFVRREKLFELMGRQAEEIFFGALLVGRGQFYFLDTFDASVLSARHAIPLAGLVREGVRRMHEARSFRSRIPSDHHVPVPQRIPPPELDTGGLFEMLDGRRSIADLCRLRGEPDFVVLRNVFQLMHQGFVAIRPPRREPKQIVTACNEAVALILRELDAMDEGDAVRAQLAEFAAGGVFVPLFAGAGPADDGTFDTARVLANFAAFPPTGDNEQLLSVWLREYAAYALFLARPHVSRASTSRQPAETKRLSLRVGALLDQISGDDRGRRTGGA